MMDPWQCGRQTPVGPSIYRTPFAGLVLLCVCAWPAPANELPAFPGAVGQGSQAAGGRGGDVYHVTTLHDYNPRRETKIPGSLRHAVRSTTGPRTIVFDVSGVIQLHAPLEILKSNLTIAGQTSPGGITLCGYPLQIARGHDVVLQYLRIRTGDFHARQPPAEDSALAPFDPGSANGAHVGGGCERVILDHVSICWGIDETLSVTECRNVTVQHCLITESLDNSFHPKGPHGYGSLIRGLLTSDDQAAATGGFTFFGNLWAHHRARNPSIGGQQRISRGNAERDRLRTDVNLVNNVIYNWRDAPTHRSQLGDVRINLIGNYYINGPAKKSSYIFREGDSGKTELFHQGNRHDADQDRTHHGPLIGASETQSAFQYFDATDRLLDEIAGKPFDFVESVKEHLLSAEHAYDRIVHRGGASLWRDAIDRRVIESLVNRCGAILDSQESLREERGLLAGIDDLSLVRRPDDFDVDQDGLSDAFERRVGLNPADPSDGNATTLSPVGYTNLEVYLHGLTSL
jgi:hypothetical protein